MRRACLQIFSALDFTPLANAVTGLREGLVRFATEESDTQIRDGLIQRFEFTYDLSHKMLRRVIEAGAANPEEVDRMTFPTLIRTAAEQGRTGPIGGRGARCATSPRPLRRRHLRQSYAPYRFARANCQSGNESGCT